MADGSPTEDYALDSQSSAIDLLRSVAQEHLQKINEERIQEQNDGWDKDLDIAKYLVGYLERFEGIKEMPAKNWISESTDEEWIPQHRIKYFKKICEGGDHDIVWDRERRVDKVFGTGAGPSRIDEDDKVAIVSEDGGVRLMP